MSFDNLKRNNAILKEEVVIKTESGEYKFTAKTISYFQKIEIFNIRAAGGDWLLNFVVFSIFDEKDKPMTLAQAYELPDEVAEIFVEAALKVNPMGEVKKS